ncbi:putative glycosyltransferase [Halobacteriovorax marinus SJ]|uniref:Glycosyltransferase n=1 Tax=Halobacteriovorax marinus (strain ATCC BAA-682 / DSM 15412 / SJ) TaxID=862908 RepID=E1X3W7_HALMS|nr:glycosyltransferase [Halobacteriovorax marinus]CBW25307.1 putative glycosyltransferase [Halobacteriovorax marinus SJ]
MKIVFEHKGILPVKKYGGIERILFWHMKELAKRGHEVILFGHPESDVERFGITLLPGVKQAQDLDDLIPDDADIVHLTYNYIPKTKVPTIVNMQCNGKIGEKFPRNSVFVSKKHAENHGAEVFIHNALDFSEYPYNSKSSKSLESFLFLAKGSWSVKNLKHCIKACKKAKKNLHIAGGRSLLPSKYIHSHGMVGGEEKLAVMKKCDAFLFPVRWHEPFGIAIIEAMAMGMPVLGSPYGSLPEIIQPIAGKICHNYEQLLSEISKKDSSYEPDKIREYVEEHFSIEKLTDEYLKLYEKVISGNCLHKEEPTWQLPQDSEDLLEY